MRAHAALLVLAACGQGAVAPVPGGAGESCAKPLLVTLPVDLGATTAGFADDDGNELSSCGGGGSPDVVFAFSASAGQRVTATVTPDGFQASLKLRTAARGCKDLDQACSNKPGVVELTDEPIDIGGLQYLIVDGPAMASGPFHVAVSLK